MKIKYIAMAMTSALLAVGLIPLASAQDDFGGTQAGIEVITVVGKRPTQEGIEVITVVGKRPAPTVASTCVNEVMAGRASNAQALESRQASRNSVRQAIKDCIDQAQMETSRS
jgi:O-acetyl-ADP-ribose deacetylase (regulator of RNase III)